MRPILRPSARVRLRSPADVGAASCVGGASAEAVLGVFLTALERGATATAVGALVGGVVAFSSGPLVSPGGESSGSSGLVARAIVVWLALLFGLLAEGVLVFAFGAVVGPGRLAVATLSFSSTMTLGGDVLDVVCWEGAALAG